MLIVAALGGNALLPRGAEPDAAAQITRVKESVTGLLKLAEEHDLVITHGNGPQVGLLALESSSDPRLTTPYPLDSLVAETQGLIGHWISNALGERACTLLTHVEVDPEDPAFSDPTKFIGPTYDEETARQIAERHGWVIAADGDSWRRVVPSPVPQRIIELAEIEDLVRGGSIVICVGGGGIPVARATDGTFTGVEAVVDKDLSSALLAEKLKADLLLLLTDVTHVYADFGTEHPRAIGHVTADEIHPSDFPAGSVRPKLRAAIDYVRATGARAAIGHLDAAVELASGTTGTQITPRRG
jgi:carbamate kinase